MPLLPLRLGALGPDQFTIQHSGFRFRKSDGQTTRAGEVFAYCNVSLRARSPAVQLGPSFEDSEFQVALASRVPGRLRIPEKNALGGYLSLLGVVDWDERRVVAEIDVDASVADQTDDASELRLLTLAGRRMTALADVHGGLLPGWHAQSRAWWGAEPHAMVTLLSLGICDATGAVKGDDFAFLEMFEQTSDPTHVVFTPDYPVIPCAPILYEQFTRTPEDAKAIQADILAALLKAEEPADASDLIFSGTLLNWLWSNSIAQRFDVLAPGGVASVGQADAILLSLNAEPTTILRHKRLGYGLAFMRHHLSTAATKCARWRRKSVPVGLREKGRKALVSCAAARIEACGA